jgi:hypothetical protein
MSGTSKVPVLQRANAFELCQVNALGYLRVMFAVDDLDETLARIQSPARSSSAK